MNELLSLAVKADGHLERWNKRNAIKVEASITGGIWYVKGEGLGFVDDSVYSNLGTPMTKSHFLARR
jgi:hypothetical protein